MSEAMKKAKAALVRHGRPGRLVHELTDAEIDRLAAIEGNDFELFDAFWGAFRERLAEAKATVEGVDEEADTELEE